MRSKVTVFALALVMLVGWAHPTLGQIINRDSQLYSPETRVFNVPPNAMRKFVGLETALTRESWPGAGTIALAASPTDTVLVLDAGQGPLFPLANGWLLVRSGGQVEHMWLVARVGDVLTVLRTHLQSPPVPYAGPAIDIAPGATIRVQDLVTVTTERTLDGVNWELADRFACPGGDLFLFGAVQPSCGPSRTVWRLPDGSAMARNGDVRIAITNRVRLQTAIRMRVFEVGEIARLAPGPEPHRSVAHDGEANVTDTLGGVTSKTLAGKTTAGSNRCGVLHLPYYDTVGTDVPSAPTWGGTNMTLGVNRLDANGISRAKLYRLVAPATAASDVVVTWTDAAYGGIAASSYTDVDQTTPVSNTASGEGADTPVSVTVTSATGEMVVDAVQYVGEPLPTVGAGQTEVFYGAELGVSGSMSYEAGAASVEMSWSWPPAGVEWTSVAMSLQEDTGGVAAPKRLLLLGIGSLMPLWPAWWRWRRSLLRASSRGTMKEQA